MTALRYNLFPSACDSASIERTNHMRTACWATCLGLILFVMLGADAPATAPSQKESLTIDLGGGVSIELLLIHPGSFLMGSDKGKVGANDDEKPVHKVKISTPFYLGKFE